MMADAIAQRFRVRQNMSGEKNCLAFVLELRDEIANFAAAHGIKSRHRLVEENDFGVMQNGLRNSHALQHAFGELAQLHSAHIGQTDALQDFIHFARSVFRIHSGKLAIVLQQFAGGEVVVKVRLLGQKSDLRLHAGIVDFHPQNAGRAAGGEYQSHEQFEGGGFAGAVGPRKPKTSPSSTVRFSGRKAYFGFLRQKPTE